MKDLRPLPQRFLKEAHDNLVKSMQEDLSSPVLEQADTAGGLLEASIDEMVEAELEEKIDEMVEAELEEKIVGPDEQLE